jgi:hypothetical protein
MSSRRLCATWCHANGAKYVLILGGDNIVPFFRVPDRTPVAAPGQAILSDSYYFESHGSDLSHWPEAAVGRMPDGGDDVGELLVAQLGRSARAHRAGGLQLNGGNLGLSTHTWQVASASTYKRIDKFKKGFFTSPPIGRALSPAAGVKRLLDAAMLPKAGILFVNLHGHHAQPLWWGEQRVAGFPVRWPSVLDLKLAQQIDFTDTVVFCEACHGAAIHRHTTTSSLALCALKQGAPAFFGSTVATYSITSPDAAVHLEAGIDALFSHLIDQIVRRRARFGEALCDAKQYYQFDNAFDEKNGLGLTLLGDPMLRLGGRVPVDEGHG